MARFLPLVTLLIPACGFLHQHGISSTMKRGSPMVMVLGSRPPSSPSEAVNYVKRVASSLVLAVTLMGTAPDMSRMLTEGGKNDLIAAPPSALALSEEQDVVNEVWRVVNQAYVDRNFNGLDWKAVRLKVLKKEFRNKAEAYATAKDMLKGLGDPYTRFLTPDEFDAVKGLARGGAAGVGLELATGPGDGGGEGATGVVVAGVVKGSPAEAGGLKSGDTLLAVDGEQVLGDKLDYAASLLRGEIGSKVRLDVRRGGAAMVFPLTRADFKYQGVLSEVRQGPGGGRIGVVTIKVFSKETAEDVRLALSEVVNNGAQSLVLDLRHNPGGFFPGGIDTARLFLPSEETIVSVIDRNSIIDSYQTLADGKYASLPLALVVDQKTASASEILTAALKENGRAKLAGRTTFGKAKVQTLNQLLDGSGVAVTISLYKTPLGNDINGKGIPVDFPSDCPYPGDVLACLPPQALR